LHCLEFLQSHAFLTFNVAARDSGVVTPHARSSDHADEQRDLASNG
jgi:hypothetical protein